MFTSLLRIIIGIVSSIAAIRCTCFVSLYGPLNLITFIGAMVFGLLALHCFFDLRVLLEMAVEAMGPMGWEEEE